MIFRPRCRGRFRYRYPRPFPARPRVSSMFRARRGSGCGAAPRRALRARRTASTATRNRHPGLFASQSDSRPGQPTVRRSAPPACAYPAVYRSPRSSRAQLRGIDCHGAAQSRLRRRPCRDGSSTRTSAGRARPGRGTAYRSSARSRSRGRLCPRTDRCRLSQGRPSTHPGADRDSPHVTSHA